MTHILVFFNFIGGASTRDLAPGLQFTLIPSDLAFSLNGDLAFTVDGNVEVTL